MQSKANPTIAYSVVLMMSALAFWALAYPEAIYFQEKMQMFLWDGDYLMEFLSYPGDLCDYAAEFLVQFSYHYWLGALILAAQFTAIYLLTLRCSQMLHPGTEASLIHAVPAMALWYIMSDINVMPGLVMAIISSLALAWGAMRMLEHKNAAMQYLTVALLSAAYYITGPAMFLALIIVVAYIIMHRRPTALAICAVVLTAVSVAISIRLVYMPVIKFIYGFHYYRFHNPQNSILALLAISGIIPMVRIKGDILKSKAGIAVQCLLWASWLPIVANAFNTPSHQIAHYTRLAHQQRWGDIVEHAGKKGSLSKGASIIVNLALAQQGKLTSQMFRFYQDGMETLLPSVGDNHIDMMLSAEAMFQIGLNDHAIHYFFETKTGNPTYRDAVLPILRLTEAYMVDGEYNVADKYINKLRKTLFYKKKAKDYEKLIRTFSVQADPYFAPKIARKLGTDGILSGNDNIEGALEALVAQSPDNHPAYEYLIGARLLCRDLEGVAKALQMNAQANLQQAPIHIQEAMAYYWYQSRKTMDGMPQWISNDVRQRLAMRNPTQDSYWNYLINGKQQ